MTYRGFKIHQEPDYEAGRIEIFVLGGHFMGSCVIYSESEDSPNYGIEQAKAAIDRFLDVDTPKGFRFRGREYQLKMFLNEGKLYVFVYLDGKTIKIKRFETASPESAYWDTVTEIIRDCQN